MTFIPWTAALKLDVPIIDEQHRVLVDLINALHALKFIKGIHLYAYGFT